MSKLETRGTRRRVDTTLTERLGAHGAREMAYEVPRVDERLVSTLIASVKQ